MISKVNKMSNHLRIFKKYYIEIKKIFNYCNNTKIFIDVEHLNILQFRKIPEKFVNN